MRFENARPSAACAPIPSFRRIGLLIFTLCVSGLGAHAFGQVVGSPSGDASLETAQLVRGDGRGEGDRRSIEKAASQELGLPIRVLSDVSYAETDNPRQRLDLYLPKQKTEEALPVVVFIHGGGWRQGDKRSGRQRLIPLVSSGGYAGVSVGYRLSGESKWPTQIHDCKAAIRWIRAHAAEHGIDPDRIAVWGTSAGGHLVSMLGTTADVEAMNGDIGTHDAHSERVTCVVDFFGPTDLLKMNAMAIEGATLDHDAPTSPESLLIGEPIQSAVDKTKTANPIGYVTPDDAAFLIVHGTMDPLVSYQQSVIFHETLRDVGVRSTLITVEGGGHGKGFGRDVDAAVVRFLDHHLRGREVEWSDERVRAESVRRRKSIR